MAIRIPIILDPSHDTQLKSSKTVQWASGVMEPEPNRNLENLLVDGKCGSVENALRVFNAIAQPDPFSWRSKIMACARSGYLFEAKAAYAALHNVSEVAWETIVTAYGQ